ncbi:MAG: hypothetical protein NXH97_07385 [Rhodobacteraceae bacterium]|nr:hypothetical protein [Paracoccaceae bacterium]
MTRMLTTLFVDLPATGLSAMASLGTDASDACIDRYLAIGGGQTRRAAGICKPGRWSSCATPVGRFGVASPVRTDRWGELSVAGAADDG